MIGTSAYRGSGHPSVSKAAASSHHLTDELAYRTLFAVMFSIFLPAALVKRVLAGLGLRPAGVRRSIIEDARVAASTASACAFMG